MNIPKNPATSYFKEHKGAMGGPGQPDAAMHNLGRKGLQVRARKPRDGGHRMSMCKYSEVQGRRAQHHIQEGGGDLSE